MSGRIPFARLRPTLTSKPGTDEMMLGKKSLEIFVACAYIAHSLASLFRLVKNIHLLRCAPPPRSNVLKRVRLRSSLGRAPRIWQFLTSLSLDFFTAWA
jgi:hypothetical protein